MSLFRVQEWFASTVPGAWSMTAAQLVEYRDQLVVGSLEGTLTVLDPGGNPENRQELAIMAEIQVDTPILQVTTGKFLPSSFEQLLIAALHPHTLTYFRLISKDKQYICEQVFEHKLTGPPAFNMCQGHFGRSNTEQVCVQSISCSLMVFEAENRVLSRPPPTDAIHPGPIEYTAFSESILTTSGGYLTSIRYNVLTSSSTSSSNAAGAKKVNVDWSLNLGDTPLALAVIGVLPVQPSILVLCKRVLYCVTHGGTPRFTIRFQCVALCMVVNDSSKDAGIHLCVGTSTKTLLFYHDTRMIWTAQLDFIPTSLAFCTFSDSLRSLLATLSDDHRLSVGYLGTEPALFRMPVTESRFIDFEVRKRELREFEETIWRHSRENPNNKDGASGGAQIEVQLSVDVNKSVNDGIPIGTALISASGVMRGTRFELLFEGEIFAHPKQFTFSTEESGGQVPITLLCQEDPVLDARCQLLAMSNMGEILMKEFTLPLRLICREAPAQRTANFKLTLESSGTIFELGKLFPEFNQQENLTQLGFQPFFADSSIVSVFTSAKTNRYRIQSDSTDFLFVVLSELLARVRDRQPDAKLNCSVPMSLFLTAITKHLELENKCDALEKEVNRISIQTRQIETIFLSKVKMVADENQEASVANAQHINALMNYTYRELMTMLDALASVNAQINTRGKRPLRALLNLMKLVLELSDVQMPFDGRIVDGTGQKLSDRLFQLLSPNNNNQSSDGSTVTTHEPMEICRLLANFCEGSGKLNQIAEIPEGEEGELAEKEEAEKEEKSRREMARAVAEAEAGYEFANLESGSLPAMNLATLGNV